MTELLQEGGALRRVRFGKTGTEITTLGFRLWELGHRGSGWAAVWGPQDDDEAIDGAWGSCADHDPKSVRHRRTAHRHGAAHTPTPDGRPLGRGVANCRGRHPERPMVELPPHKHDQDDRPRETYLEETHYHKIQPPQGF